MTDPTTTQGARFLVNVAPHRLRMPGLRRREQLTIDAHHLMERPASLRRFEDAEVLSVHSVTETYTDVGWALPTHTFLILSKVNLRRGTPEIRYGSRATLVTVREPKLSWDDKSILHRGITDTLVAF